MSSRVDTTSLIAGACVVGNLGLGLSGLTIRTTTAAGTHGPGLLQPCLSPADDTKEIRGFITSTSPGVTITSDEAGAFAMTVPGDGTHWVTLTLYEDGVTQGSMTYTVVVGGAAPPPPTPPAQAQRQKLTVREMLRAMT